jgi:nicotinate-nucleotide adenylyltransferase
MIIPDFIPPHKSFAGTVTPEQRLDMCKLAFSHIKNVVVSDLEISRGGKSYTANTLTELSCEDRELYFLCGTDMFLTLDSWYSPKTIFDLATICYVRREADETLNEEIKRCTALYEEKYAARIIAVDMDTVELSSTEVRADLLASGVCDAIPESVMHYIKREGLYK